MEYRINLEAGYSGEVKLVTGEVVHGDITVLSEGVLYIERALTKREGVDDWNLEDVFSEPVNLFVPHQAVVWWRAPTGWDDDGEDDGPGGVEGIAHHLAKNIDNIVGPLGLAEEMDRQLAEDEEDGSDG